MTAIVGIGSAGFGGDFTLSGSGDRSRRPSSLARLGLLLRRRLLPLGQPRRRRRAFNQAREPATTAPRRVYRCKTIQPAGTVRHEAQAQFELQALAGNAKGRVVPLPGTASDPDARVAIEL